MYNKQAFINLSEKIRASKIRETSKFKEIINSLSYVDILKVSDQIILLCLQFEVNCQDLINIQAE